MHLLEREFSEKEMKVLLHNLMIGRSPLSR